MRYSAYLFKINKKFETAYESNKKEGKVGKLDSVRKADDKTTHTRSSPS